MEKLTIGVIFGGRTVEHEVSVISALQVIGALDKNKYEPIPIYISKQGRWYSGEALQDLKNYQNIPALLSKLKPVYYSAVFDEWLLRESNKAGLFSKAWQQRLDVALPVLHGTHGEDGCLQGLLELSGIPYAGPGVLGAALGMDKIAMKAMLKEAGLPITDYICLSRREYHDNEPAVLDKIENALSYPLIIKPANLGSSIGISRVANRRQLQEALRLVVNLSLRIMAESAVTPLREFNCAVLGSGGDLITSCVEEPIAAADMLSFADKYLENVSGKGMSGAKRRLPADIEESLASHIADLSRRAFSALDGAGVARIDFLYNSASQQLYINEINTIPGSLAFYLFEPAGLSYSALLDELIHLALERYREKGKLTFTYDSNILKQSRGKK
ncbi:MAG: D-alanine--D-alanine ligase [Clostridiales bacterium]|nr:D-alanine--D-alanine ligase [Clostridiales bacterium]